MIIPASADNYQIEIPQGAHNRLCATFHNCYSPEKITIQTGDTITWPNKDSEPHTVTSGAPGKSDDYFDSGLYKPNESWEFTFLKPGSFDYYCVIHPWMLGTVTVTGESKETPSIIPQWIKDNARWWSENQISDSDFVLGIQYLIQQKIMVIPYADQTDEEPNKIPEWVKNNAGWWAEGVIDDDSFI